MKKRVVLTFPKQTIEEPITYHLIRDYDLMVNILSAKVNPNEEGRMVIELSGRNKRMNNGIEYLKGLGVTIQSLAQDVTWDEQKCIHCTACISLCPSHALSVDRSQMLVSFNPDCCIVCGLCLKACPYHAIEIQF